MCLRLRDNKMVFYTCHAISTVLRFLNKQESVANYSNKNWTPNLTIFTKKAMPAGKRYLINREARLTFYLNEAIKKRETATPNIQVSYRHRVSRFTRQKA